MFQQCVEVSLVTFTSLPFSSTFRVPTPFRQMGRLLICSDRSPFKTTILTTLAMFGHSFSPESFKTERLSSAGFPKSSNRSYHPKCIVCPTRRFQSDDLVHFSNTASLVRFWNPRDTRLKLQQLLGCPMLFCCYSEDRLCALPSSPNQWGSPKVDFLLLCHPVNTFSL